MFSLLASNSEHIYPTMTLGLVFVGTLLFCFTNKRNKQLPPYVPVGIFGRFEAMKMNGPDLNASQLARSIGSVFRLHQSIATEIVIVADALVARAIYYDSLTVKPRKLMAKIDRRVGGEDMQTLLTKQGSAHKAVRTSVSPGFAPKHVRRMKNVCYSELQKWIHNTIDSRPGETFDPFHEMTCLTLRVVCKEAFEYDITDDEINMFISENSKYMYEVYNMQGKYPWRKWCTFLIPSVRRAYEACENVAVFASRILTSYRKKVKLGVASDEDTFIKLVENSSVYKSEKEKIAEILLIISASYNSTGHSIAWILYELAKQPQIVESYRSEIKGMADVHEWANTDCLRRIVREGLRLHAIFPHVAREVGRDIHGKNDKARDFIIPKGTIVRINADAIQRSPEYYSNPDGYDPSRWINPSTEAMDAFMPFALGRRNCVGQSLASAEMHIVVAKLAAEYNLEVAEEGRSFQSFAAPRKGTRLIARKNTGCIN